jgi:WhiB family redox-sensing transcriptional regulator
MSKVLYVHPQQAADWEERALCRNITDQEMFFPEHGNRSPAKAKAICRRCSVRLTCLETALRNDEDFGIWGGLTERERRNLSRRAGAA